MNSSETNALLNEGAAAAPDTRAAYRNYVAKHGFPGEPKRAPRPIWAGVVAACALVALFSFAPARSWGQKILSMLRVQKVAVVPLDMEAISAATGPHQKLLAQLISDRVVVTIQPGKPAPESTPEAAAAAAGFEVKTLDALGTPSGIWVRDESAFHVQLDRDRILNLLEAAGRSDIAVPPQVDGAEVAVHIPKAVDIQYGDCSGASRESCVHFTQIPTPAISIPSSLNMADLAEAALQLGGMSASEAAAFCRTVDWSSTLVIPVPRSGSTTRTVAVDGVNGTLVQAEGRHGADYVLLWVKDRRLYSVAGNGAPDPGACCGRIASVACSHSPPRHCGNRSAAMLPCVDSRSM